jgi:hypothetical protein
MATMRQVFSDIPGYKPKTPKKKKKFVEEKPHGIDWGKDDPNNFDQRDTQNDTTG